MKNLQITIHPSDYDPDLKTKNYITMWVLLSSRPQTDTDNMMQNNIMAGKNRSIIILG
jgi:hypothetical protein